MNDQISEEQRVEALEDDLSVHIFSVSAAMVGVCLTVIGLFRLISHLNQIVSIGDDLLALDAILFLVSCILAYLALRTRERQRRQRMERVADAVFLFALTVMAAICALITYELV